MEAVSTVIEYFLKGGFVMWPLLLCSVIVVSIAIERWLYYKEVDSGDAFADSYCNLLAEQKDADAGKLASCCKGHCAQIVAEAGSFCCCSQCRAYLETKSSIAIAKLRSNLNYLSIIVTMAPLLGLLGTIIGMINSFSIFDLQAGAPMAITGGIGEGAYCNGNRVVCGNYGAVRTFIFCAPYGRDNYQYGTMLFSASGAQNKG